jgi:hypothetical protein
MPGKIIGRIPDVSSTKLYQIQVGAFKNFQNAENVNLRLKKEGYSPVYEKYLDLTRVMITEIPAAQITRNLIKIKQMGFDEVIIREDNTKIKQMGFGEVIIREDNTKIAISEKWEVTTPGSAYSSFEFNQDQNYIAIKNATPEEAKRTYFGEYTMPARDTIRMDKLGILKIGADNGDKVNLSFSPIDEPGKEIKLTALKSEKMPESPELDLFCRTWKVVNCTKSEFIEDLLFISNSGTYFFTTADGKSNRVSQWRWYNNKKEEFEYSHDNWEHYGRVKILDLSINFLNLMDPGYITIIPGYSSAGNNEYWELIPIN